MTDSTSGAILLILIIIASLAFGGGFAVGLFTYRDLPGEPIQEGDRSKHRTEYALEVAVASFRSMLGLGLFAWVFAAAASVFVFLAWMMVAGGLVFLGLMEQGDPRAFHIGIALAGIVLLLAQGFAAVIAVKEARSKVGLIDKRGRYAPALRGSSASPSAAPTQKEQRIQKLRWIGLLPGAVAGGLAIDSLIQLLFFRSPYSASILSAIGFHAGLIVLGVYIAPSRKHAVCLGLTVLSIGIGLAFTLGFLIYAPGTLDYLDAAVRVGAPVGAYLSLNRSLAREP